MSVDDGYQELDVRYDQKQYEALCKIIEKAREILGANGEHWTKGAYYKDDTDSQIEEFAVETTDGPWDEEAEVELAVPQPALFCVLGSIRFAAFTTELLSPEEAESFFTDVAVKPEGKRIIAVANLNDEFDTAFPVVATMLDQTKDKVCALAAGAPDHAMDGRD